MEYELAKQLKDAGFPQDFAEGDGYQIHPPTCTGWEPSNQCTRADVAYVPTLEEAIEACGYDFHLLRRMEEGWLIDNCSELSGMALNGNRKEFIAPTPTEAVAKLWLALNKK